MAEKLNKNYIYNVAKFLARSAISCLLTELCDIRCLIKWLQNYKKIALTWMLITLFVLSGPRWGGRLSNFLQFSV